MEVTTPMRATNLWRSEILGPSRGARALRASAVSLVGRVISIGGTLITIPLVLNHLGPERYGLWMTLSVIFVFLRLADGGVTIGLIALVSRADGVGDFARIRALFASAFAITIAVAALLAALAVLVRFVDWHWLLKISDPALQADAAAATVIIILSMALGFPSGVVRQGRTGLQQGAEANLWDLAGSLITFVGQVAVVYLKLGLIALAAVTAFTPVIVNTVMSVVFFVGKGRDLLPRAKSASRPVARALFVSGSMFMALTLVQALSLQIDTVLIARLIGVTQVADYSIVQKLMSQPQLLITMYLIPQFAAYSEALTRGDHDWIVRQFKRTVLIATLLSVAACGLLAFAASPLLKLWIGSAISPSPTLVASLAVYGVVATVANVFTYFFFALGLYRQVILAYALMIVINIPLALILIPQIGPAGAAIATSTGLVLALIVPSLFTVRAVFGDLPRLQKEAADGLAPASGG
mgnify:CR=1 FL=1